MNSNRRVVAFSGPSNSGKTSTIIKLTQVLKAKAFDVCVIKHDPDDKAVFDTVGKDSYKFTQAGAMTAVVSPKKTTYLKNETSSIDEIIKTFGDFDYLFVEGLKNIELPKISIFREKLDESYYSFTDAIACDDTINKNEIPRDIEILDLNNITEILTWIDKNAKRV